MNDTERAIEYYRAKNYEKGGLRDKYTKLAIEVLEKQIEIKEYLKQLDENHKDFTKTMTIYEVESDVLDFVIEEVEE